MFIMKQDGKDIQALVEQNQLKEAYNKIEIVPNRDYSYYAGPLENTFETQAFTKIIHKMIQEPYSHNISFRKDNKDPNQDIIISGFFEDTSIPKSEYEGFFEGNSIQELNQDLKERSIISKEDKDLYKATKKTKLTGAKNSMLLKDLMKNVNLTHVTLTENDAKAYFDLYINGEITVDMKENPQDPPKFETFRYQDLMEKAKQNIFDPNNQDKIEQQDIKNLSEGEKLALIIYTGPEYTKINGLARSNKLNNLSDIPDALRHLAMASSALNKLSKIMENKEAKDNTPIDTPIEIPITLRQEKYNPARLLEFEEALETGKIIEQKGMFSTATNISGANQYGNSTDKVIRLIIENKHGKHLELLSIKPKDKEHLAPHSTQIRITGRVDTPKGPIFTAQGANMIDLMPAGKASYAEKHLRKRELKINYSEIDDLENKPVANNKRQNDNNQAQIDSKKPKRFKSVAEQVLQKGSSSFGRGT